MPTQKSIELMTEALQHFVTGLDLLDEADAPGEIGAHVDMGRARLAQYLEVIRKSDAIANRSMSRPA